MSANTVRSSVKSGLKVVPSSFDLVIEIGLFGLIGKIILWAVRNWLKKGMSWMVLRSYELSNKGGVMQI